MSGFSASWPALREPLAAGEAIFGIRAETRRHHNASNNDKRPKCVTAGAEQ